MTALIILAVICLIVYGISLAKAADSRRKKKKMPPPLEDHELFYHKDWQKFEQ